VVSRAIALSVNIACVLKTAGVSDLESIPFIKKISLVK
jgi:hypothetical protein